MTKIKVIYLTPAQVIFIHDKMVARFGGSHGIRDLGLIESAVYRAQAAYSGEEFYKTIFEKAAALLQSLLKNHPFVDGNKRTALTSAGVFLKLNGYRLKNAKKEEVEFAVRVDNQNLDLAEIALWLESHCQK